MKTAIKLRGLFIMMAMVLLASIGIGGHRIRLRGAGSAEDGECQERAQGKIHWSFHDYSALEDWEAAAAAAWHCAGSA